MEDLFHELKMDEEENLKIALDQYQRKQQRIERDKRDGREQKALHLAEEASKRAWIAIGISLLSALAAIWVAFIKKG